VALVYLGGVGCMERQWGEPSHGRIEVKNGSELRARRYCAEEGRWLEKTAAPASKTQTWFLEYIRSMARAACFSLIFTLVRAAIRFRMPQVSNIKL